MNKRQINFINEIETKYLEDGNIFFKPMEYKDFRDYIMEYFCGNDWYSLNPVNDKQINVELLLNIIKSNKVTL